jgi:hypothetical protein
VRTTGTSSSVVLAVGIGMLLVDCPRGGLQLLLTALRRMATEALRLV